MSAPPATRLADRLMPAVLGLRRALRRRVRSHLPGPRLGSAQAELLRAVEDAPGCGVADAARALSLAQNSVSTLVHHAVRDGLLDRIPDPADRRAARLTLTPAAVDRLRRWRDARNDVVDAALARLGEADRAALAAAVPALERLQTILAEEHP